MRLYKNTGCRVYLIGYLADIPEIKMDQTGEVISAFTLLRRQNTQYPDDLILTYRIFVNGQKALFMRQFGFPGLYLWIEGDITHNNEIHADNICFLDFNEPGENNGVSARSDIHLMQKPTSISPCLSGKCA